MPRQSPTGPASSRGGRQGTTTVTDKPWTTRAQTRRRPPCPPRRSGLVRRRCPPVDRRIRTAAAVSSRSQPARPASVAYVDHPPVEQGPPSCPGAARAAAFEAEQAQQAERQQARPAPRPVKPAAPKPKGKPGLNLLRAGRERPAGRQHHRQQGLRLRRRGRQAALARPVDRGPASRRGRPARAASTADEAPLHRSTVRADAQDLHRHR